MKPSELEMIFANYFLKLTKEKQTEILENLGSIADLAVIVNEIN